MRKIVLIASSHMVPLCNWETFKTDVTKMGRGFAVEVGPFEHTDGPGCSNLAVAVVGEESAIEAFANNLTMALMPARWTFTEDEPTGEWSIEAMPAKL